MSQKFGKIKFNEGFEISEQNIDIMQFLKISTLTPWEVFVLNPTPLPSGNSSLASHIASKILAFKTPLPLRIFNDLPWGGYGYFLELHIIYNSMKNNINS